MRRLFPLLLVVVVLLCGCSNESAVERTYLQISQDEAKKMIDSGDVIILDVREQYEYDESHIVDAVLLPLGTIGQDTAAALILEKDSVVLVYCRSGNRSKQASQKLVELGYENVYEFGGINTWPYEVQS